MEKKPDNPRAFPNTYDAGMTLRDYFAGQALAGSCASAIPGRPTYTAEQLAAGCYALADAMLAERAK